MKESIKEVLSSGVKDKRVIGFMVLKGFAGFLTVTGLIGLSFILGPLNLIIKFEFTTIFGNTALDAILCLMFCVVGGGMDFFADSFIRHLSSQYNKVKT